MQFPTACIIIIGNEVLSGRTKDVNLSWLATNLNDIGVRVMECRVIPDIEEVIVSVINSARKHFTYVFTTGGIGPTHDDITSASVAKAFNKKLIRHPEAVELLTKHYPPDQLNEARLKMAETPEGATLIYNPVSAAPGYIIDNVYVMAGVPRIMQAMFDGIKHSLKGGAKMHSHTISAYVTEGVIAAELTQIQNDCPQTEIGSYPFVHQQRLGTSLVIRATDTDAIQFCAERIKFMLLKYTPDLTEGDFKAEAL
jgi:molybdenum cofactor synthesis domain-containing protein